MEQEWGKGDCKKKIACLLLSFSFFVFIHTGKTDFLKLRFLCKVDFFPACIFLMPSPKYRTFRRFLSLTIVNKVKR